uniref:Cytochrome P450, family 46, subfamily A, polypeptide 1, tandem duplicate 4 n=1 Tax=Astatotilapia calliptera TaxID=8154 RepID=A0A3P8R3Z8_ASTCA
MAVFSVFLTLATPSLTFFFFLLIVAFLAYCLYVRHIHMKYDHIPGPPRDSFLLGHSPSFLRIMKNGGVVHDKYLEWAEKYGPVYRTNGLHYVVVCVSSPEATKEILMSPKYPKDKFLCKKLFSLFGQRFLGNGLVTARDHEKWYKQRRIMDPAFSSTYLRGLTGTFNERAEKLMDKLADVADSKKEANMLHLVNCVTLDVITKVAFGVDLDLLKNSSPFPKAIETCLKGMVYYLRDRFFQVLLQRLGYINEVREACRLLRTTGAKWISARKTAMQNGDEVPKDILTQIIKTASQGQETTANQLAFAIMELGRHPDILEKMYPTAPGTSRDIAEDMVIDGIHIPGGFVALFSSYVSGRLDKFFEDPLKFDPDRFHPDAPKPYYCYYPFSLGPRACLGQNFAQMEAKVVMAKLLQRFDFTLVPEQTFDILDAGTLRPKSGVLCTLGHRDYKNK